MKLILSSYTDAADNLAIEEAILEQAKEDTVMLWRNEKCVIIGRNQNTDAEANMELCKSENCKVIRRSSGGGAVFQDMGNINYSFIHREEDGESNAAEAAFMKALISFLEDFGVKGAFSNRNDILIEGRKFSGTARMQKGENCLLHGTLLYESDLELMDRLLTPPEEKLKHNGVESVRSRVRNIGDICEIPIGQFINEMALFMKREFSAVLENTDNYLQEAEKYKNQKYGNYQWNFGRNQIF